MVAMCCVGQIVETVHDMASIIMIGFSKPSYRQQIVANLNNIYINRKMELNSILNCISFPIQDYIK